MPFYSCMAVAPGAKHAWCLQFPDLFAALLRAWVTDKPLPEGNLTTEAQRTQRKALKIYR